MLLILGLEISDEAAVQGNPPARGCGAIPECIGWHSFRKGRHSIGRAAENRKLPVLAAGEILEFELSVTLAEENARR